ncbi:conserved hypothetical protein, secreted [Candidatus Magnetomorum sp. HK-1]|nr:conserved hypothetical protein, secreted [Candidatus Magnetomorum sp. HK-1]
MQTIVKIYFYMLLMVQISSISFADSDPANPAKTKKPCGFPDDMNCFENKKVADADEVNANFKALLGRIDNINSVNGNIGIGTNSPSSGLHLYGGGWGSIITLSNTSTGRNWHMGPTETDYFTISQSNVGDWIAIRSNTGFVGIGLMYPTHRLHVNGTARSDQATFDTSSDRRVKKNITPLTGSLQKIQKLQPVTFEYIDDYKEDKESLDGKQMGFIAQDVKKVCPGMVTTTKETFGDQKIEDFHILNTSNLTPMLIDAIKELTAEVIQLKARIKVLEGKKNGCISEKSDYPQRQRQLL